eukprot:Anaeramoba_ignava/a89747_140.p4 GENE.a89747_140~~a89747_140.p4  ORF type:complete len:155 (-),score=25.77 a89747_140:4419-4883(-)
MITQKQIEELVTAKISETDIFVVEIKIKSGNSIVVFIDSPKGVSVDDCIAVSRHIESNVDREVEDYSLDVSSPGADQAFKVPGQYKKNTGEQIRVVLKDGSTFEGVLAEFSGKSILLKWEEKQKNPKTKKKELISLEKKMDLDNIASTKRILRF